MSGHNIKHMKTNHSKILDFYRKDTLEIIRKLNRYANEFQAHFGFLGIELHRECVNMITSHATKNSISSASMFIFFTISVNAYKYADYPKDVLNLISKYNSYVKVVSVSTFKRKNLMESLQSLIENEALLVQHQKNEKHNYLLINKQMSRVQQLNKLIEDDIENIKLYMNTFNSLYRETKKLKPKYQK